MKKFNKDSIIMGGSKGIKTNEMLSLYWGITFSSLTWASYVRFSGGWGLDLHLCCFFWNSKPVIIFWRITFAQVQFCFITSTEVCKWFYVSEFVKDWKLCHWQMELSYKLHCENNLIVHIVYNQICNLPQFPYCTQVYQ